jgi:hypothetical protein
MEKRKRKKRKLEEEKRGKNARKIENETDKVINICEK